MKGRGTSSAIRTPLAAFCLAAVLFVSPAPAAPIVHFTGALGGLVTDSAGKPQADAVVLLFNRQNRLLQKSATDALGSFTFADLLPDLYSVQVSVATFVPAMRENIAIRPGMRSLLAVSLSKVFSSIQLVSTSPLPGGLMTDSWKWTIRTNDALRPVLRFLPQAPGGPEEETRASVFSDSKGLIRISAADGVDLSNSGVSDLGTQFAFATSVNGGNHIEVAGGVGYATASGAPSAAIRTSYSRDMSSGASPVVSLTMRQFYMPARVGQAMAGSPNDANIPMLRTLGINFADKKEIADGLTMEYGFETDSVLYVNHQEYFSPFAKLTHDLPRGKVDFTWTSGNARPELGMSATDSNGDLQRDLNSLAALPVVTLASSKVRVQRGTDYESGVSERFGSREYRVSAYYDDVSNTALTIASPSMDLFPGDLVPDMMSNAAMFNAGRFQTSGINASVTQDLGQNYQVMVIYGSQGVLTARSDEISGTSADDLRKLLETGHREALTLRATGTIRCTGTRFITSYEWTDYRSMLPGPVFLTQPARPEPGLNVVVRQPIPALRGAPWRMEASAELRNLLAQGYLPLSMPGAQQLLLVNTPRSVRGGLAFIF
ncbi:MAG TPA: carboxypeptidase-like regulatory domain-containing protein [Bryobacteraceae bacterium]|nr:carboxypeptidase-like regulatory domain-containing protein [Bryobacteraceae bacterium]